jgi:hypothetical protein
MNSIIKWVRSISLCDRGPFHIGLAVSTSTSIGLQTYNQEIVQVIRMWDGLMCGLRQHTLLHVLGIVVGLMWGLGQDTLLYCCWFMCVGQHFTGYCCWFTWGLRQRTLLCIVGYVVPRATHFTGHCCWFVRGLRQHTLLGCCW